MDLAHNALSPAPTHVNIIKKNRIRKQYENKGACITYNDNPEV